MNDSFSRRVLLFLLAASLALSAWFAVTVPFGSNPDETAHQDYVRLITAEHGFVRFIPRGDLPADAPSRDEAHQPPLYYLLCVPVYVATGGNTFVLRLVATLLQAATVALVFFACRDLFAKRPEIAVGAAAFTAFLPTQAQLGAAINNDVLSTLICAAIFWRLGAAVLRGQTRRDVVLLGALFGVGLWTKLSVVQLVPAFALAYFLAVLGGKVTYSKAFAFGAGALVLGTVIASPWLIRNTVLYGDPLTLAIYRLTGPNFTPAAIQEGFGLSPADYLRHVGIRSFATFWYFLDPNLPPVPLAKFVGSPVALVTVLCVALATLAALYCKAKAGDFTGGANKVLLLFGLAVLLLLPFYLRFVLTVFQAQGRYFLPALLPVAVITASAWTTRPLSKDGDKIPTNYLAVLWVPAVLLIIAVCQSLGGGFVR